MKTQQFQNDSVESPHNTTDTTTRQVTNWLESLMDAGTHFFNGDRLEIAKRELEEHRATIYHRWASGHVETLFVKILECKPRAIRCRWHDWSAGVTREHDIQGADIANWIIGARVTSD